MTRDVSRAGRAGLGAACLMVSALVGCDLRTTQSTPADLTASTGPKPSASGVVTATRTPTPSSPTRLAPEQIEQEFESITRLASSGTDLYWGSGSTIWRFAPGDPGPSIAYEASDEGLIWDLAALPGSFVFSEQLTDPEGGWRVVHVDGDAAPEEIDRGFAAGGAPPTLAIDARRVAWAGFDESSGTPMSFLRVAERAAPAGTRTLVEADIETQLLWYPQLDGDTLWFARIEPDFDGTRGGDRFGLHTIDLLEPSRPREAFDGLDRIFDPAVSPDFVVWKSVEEGLSALTWGALHVLERRSNERFDIPGRYNHPTLGTRFLGFEEFFRNELLLYDLRTGSLVDVPDALPRGPGTIGHVAIGGSLLGYTITARGGTRVSWAYLPE